MDALLHPPAPRPQQRRLLTLLREASEYAAALLTLLSGLCAVATAMLALNAEARFARWIALNGSYVFFDHLISN